MLVRFLRTNFSKLILKLIELGIGKLLEINEFVARRAYGANKLIELKLNRPCIPVLCILDEEYYEEGKNRGGGVDEELPGSRETKEWTRQCPQENKTECNNKRPR